MTTDNITPTYNLVEMLNEVSSKYCNRPALVFGARKISYAHLASDTKKLAFSLQKFGINKYDKVALWLPNCPEFVLAFFAILRLGAIVVPVNTMLKREEAKFVIEDSRSKILICSIDKIIDSENILSREDALKHVISLPAPKKETSALDFYSLVKGVSELTQVSVIEENDIAEIVYTSGTTGRPKGACLTHKNLISNIEDCASIISLTKRDCLICVLPLFHSFASTVCMLLPLSRGAKIVIMRAVRPFKRIIRAIFKHRITVFMGVPSFYSILAEAHFPKFALFLNIFINPIRLCISGAAALPYETWKSFEKKFRRPLLQGYGLTEASPVVSLNPLRGRRKPESIGLALASVTVKVVDKEGKTKAQDEVGELLIKGPNVMKGYYNLEEETKNALRNGWLYTGDLAKIDKDGFIYIMGRIKEMINVRGLNVYPREIEDMLYKHPGVREAAVVGVMHKHRGEVPIAFVVKSREITEREIIKFLRASIASYKVPLRVFFKESLPKNPTGKILKGDLQKEIENIFNK